MNSFIDDITNSVSKLGKFASSDAGKGMQSLAGLGLTGYGMYKQNKLMNHQNDLMTQNYNYNKMLNDRNISKENMLQNNFTEGFSSVYGTQNKKKKLGEFGGMENFEG